MPVKRSSIIETFGTTRAIGEVFQDLATEVTVEIQVSPVFLELHPEVSNFPNLSPSSSEAG